MSEIDKLVRQTYDRIDLARSIGCDSLPLTLEDAEKLLHHVDVMTRQMTLAERYGEITIK